MKVGSLLVIQRLKVEVKYWLRFQCQSQLCHRFQGQIIVARKATMNMGSVDIKLLCQLSLRQLAIELPLKKRILVGSSNITDELCHAHIHFR